MVTATLATSGLESAQRIVACLKESPPASRSLISFWRLPALVLKTMVPMPRSAARRRMRSWSG